MSKFQSMQQQDMANQTSKHTAFSNHMDTHANTDDFLDNGKMVITSKFYDEDIAQLDMDKAAFQEREEEIVKISAAMRELTELFSDLSQMVIEQGTMVDRIDQNITRAAHQVKQGTDDVSKVICHTKLTIGIRQFRK